MNEYQWPYVVLLCALEGGSGPAIPPDIHLRIAWHSLAPTTLLSQRCRYTPYQLLATCFRSGGGVAVVVAVAVAVMRVTMPVMRVVVYSLVCVICGTQALLELNQAGNSVIGTVEVTRAFATPPHRCTDARLHERTATLNCTAATPAIYPTPAHTCISCRHPNIQRLAAVCAPCIYIHTHTHILHLYTHAHAHTHLAFIHTRTHTSCMLVWVAAYVVIGVLPRGKGKTSWQKGAARSCNVHLLHLLHLLHVFHLLVYTYRPVRATQPGGVPTIHTYSHNAARLIGLSVLVSDWTCAAQIKLPVKQFAEVCLCCLFLSPCIGTAIGTSPLPISCSTACNLHQYHASVDIHNRRRCTAARGCRKMDW